MNQEAKADLEDLIKVVAPIKDMVISTDEGSLFIDNFGDRLYVISCLLFKYLNDSGYHAEKMFKDKWLEDKDDNYKFLEETINLLKSQVN